MPLVLASGSPRRAQLLAAAGFCPTIRPAADVDETWRAPEAPIAYARRLAREKAASVLAATPGPGRDVILAADTIVWFPDDPEPLGKPTDREDAQRTLERLTSGQSHRVTTAFAVLSADTEPVVVDVTTIVHMRSVPAEELDRYLDRNEWSDKAGSYAVQGGAASFVSRIEGSYTNVVGLPLAEVVELLAAQGIRS